MRIKIPGKCYDPSEISSFLVQLEKLLNPLNITVSNVNIYLALQNENGDPIELKYPKDDGEGLEENYILNWQVKKEKDPDTGEKLNVLKKWKSRS